jgi:hypothetical protein
LQLFSDDFFAFVKLVHFLRDECGGLVHITTTGVVNVTSPGFPLSLPAGFRHCDWTVIGNRPRHRVSLLFLLVDLPPTSSEGQCTNGYLQYGDYDWRGRRVIHDGEICGRRGRDLPQFRSSTEWAWLLLVLRDRDRRNSGNGMKYSGLLVEIRLISNGAKFTHYYFRFFQKQNRGEAKQWSSHRIHVFITS